MTLWFLSADCGCLVYCGKDTDTTETIQTKFPEYTVTMLRAAKTPGAFYIDIAVGNSITIS